MRPGCSCCPASSMSIPTRASPPTTSPTASSRTRSPRRSAARRRSSRSTTRARGRRRRPIARSWPASASSGRSPRPIPRSTSRSARRSAVGMDDPIAELPAMVDAGVPTAKAFMVFDFRLADRAIFDAMRVLGERGGMLQVHCEDPVLIDTAVAGGAPARRHGTEVPRDHAIARGRGRGDPSRDGVRARGRRARPRRPPVVRRGASVRLGSSCGRGAGARRDVPALPRP